jgi:anti-sigma-K factor RsiG
MPGGGRPRPDGGDVSDHGGKRRIDRIRTPEYSQGLEQLSLDEVRERRDECRAELDYLSLLRRLVQGRAEILKAEVERRRSPSESGSLIDRLAEILAPEESRTPSRGGAVQVAVPEQEISLARRRVERLVADAELSDPSALNDDRLSSMVDLLSTEERNVSGERGDVIRVLEAIQDELKRRYKDDPSLVLS